MKDPSTNIFLVPTIALVITISLFVFFYRKAEDKGMYSWFLMSIAIISFLLNTIWELAHGPLYQGYQYDFQHVSICMLASLEDTMVVLILVFLFGVVFRNVFWANHLTMGKIIALALVGGIGATIVEMWYTSKGDWAYADAMPLIPWLGVGVSPILQFTILPIIIFFVSKRVLQIK
ncbi:MAG: hypothetical protein ABIS36_17475 [Chryseolinea sp.]